MTTASFASDNNSGVHPKIMEALAKANEGHCLAYGHDEFTETADERFAEVFGPEAEVYFVYGGTGANVSALASVTSSFNGVVCARTAHINRDECGAPEKFTGSKLLPAPHDEGRISPEALDLYAGDFGFEHHSQPGVVSVTQATEMGTVYQPGQVKAVADHAHEMGLVVHMDGARLANAAEALGLGLGELTRDEGVDVLSFGGTKNGLMFGEAVVFFRPELAKNFRYVRKQAMQLHSKMRFMAAQFSALLQGELWRECAGHSNAMARLLAEKASMVPGVEIVNKVQTNAVFARVPKKKIKALQERSYFYDWNPGEGVVRWMTSFDTLESDVDGFVNILSEVLGS